MSGLQTLALKEKYKAGGAEALSSDVLDKLCRVGELDLTAALDCAVASGELPNSHKLSAEAEFKRFLALTALADSNAPAAAPVRMADLGPTRFVDAVWHGCLLDTKNYQSICWGVLGFLLLHQIGDEAVPRPNGPMQAYLDQMFTQWDPNIWSGDLATCWPEAAGGSTVV